MYCQCRPWARDYQEQWLRPRLPCWGLRIPLHFRGVLSCLGGLILLALEPSFSCVTVIHGTRGLGSRRSRTVADVCSLLYYVVLLGGCDSCQYGRRIAEDECHPFACVSLPLCIECSVDELCVLWWKAYPHPIPSSIYLSIVGRFASVCKFTVHVDGYLWTPSSKSDISLCVLFAWFGLFVCAFSKWLLLQFFPLAPQDCAHGRR